MAEDKKDKPTEVVIEYTRQFDLIDVEKLAKFPINVIGAGAVGSATVLALAKMGAANIHVFDHDKVEPHNLPNQFYRISDVGKPKVTALQDIVKDYAGVVIEALVERFTKASKHKLVGATIICVDNMDVRMEIWKKLKNNINIPVYIDTRMGAEVANVYTFNPIEDRDFYEENLFPHSEALHVPCTARSISYTAFGIAALTTGKIKKYFNNQPYYRDLTADFRTGTLFGSNVCGSFEKKGE